MGARSNELPCCREAGGHSTDGTITPAGQADIGYAGHSAHHLTLKNRILLEHYFLPGDLEQQIEACVAHCNQQRYHESLDNLTPANVYFGRGESILRNRHRSKETPLQNVVCIINGMLPKMKTDEQNTLLNERLICSICLTTDSPNYVTLDGSAVDAKPNYQ
jgi:hypothetical protein